MKPQGHDFRKWIEAGYRDYGKDPWFFIRELAQNSRDAGATFIRVKIGHTSANEEVLVFEDDGCGMSYDHAVNYLFRLYASSKSHEKYAAGMFGIGFWTVLRFNPKRVVIESRNNKGQWGVKVDVGEELVTTRTGGHLEHKGTRITLIRTPRETSPGKFWKKTRAALVRYCSYLRRNTRKAEPLPVYFSNENITMEMRLPGPVSSKFKTSFVEGAVGLGPRPQVQLYARGLPVWNGTSLEELSHTPPTPSTTKKQYQPEIGIAQGLAPVFLLNGYQLEVNISRKRVIDNRNLQKVRQTAEKALAQMVETAADSISPRGLLQKSLDRIKTTTKSLFNSFTRTLIVSLLVIVPLEILLLRSFYKPPPKQSPGTSITLRADHPYYPGASVRRTQPTPPPGLTYYPPINTWFKLFTADEYYISPGFLQTVDKKEEITFTSLQCPRDGMSIELNTRETGKIFLPQPVGYRIESNSLTLNRSPLAGARYHSTGEVIVSILSGGTIRYRCCPVMDWQSISLSPIQEKKLTQLPGDLSLPSSIEKELQNSIHLSIDEKVKTSIRLTAAVLRYDDSIETAKKYSQSSGHSDWFRKVTTIGAGDCDILNGVNALFLRKMGVPAQLVIGLVGKQGKVLPDLHAWTEYYKNEKGNSGWNIIDASSHIPGISPGSASPLPGKEMPGIDEESLEITSSKERLSYQPVVYFLVVVLCFLLVLLFFLLYRLSRMRAPGTVPPSQFRQIQEDLAAMVLHELLHPGAWGRGSGIRNFKLIPTINNKQVSISLARALSLGTHRKLFTFNMKEFANRTIFSNIPNTDTLVTCLQQASAPILDSGNPAFAPLVRLLPGAVHLEGVFALKPRLPGKNTDPADITAQFLAAVNRQFLSISKKIPLCVLAPGLEAADFYDVDLSSLPSLEKWGLTRRFIAVNPASHRVKKLAHLFQKQPGLAQFRLITILLKESGLISYPTPVILKKVSRRLTKAFASGGQGGAFLPKVAGAGNKCR